MEEFSIFPLELDLVLPLWFPHAPPPSIVPSVFLALFLHPWPCCCWSSSLLTWVPLECPLRELELELQREELEQGAPWLMLGGKNEGGKPSPDELQGEPSTDQQT